MASKYWLKLFHETIYDPKIMMRSPGARLRWYECLCLAGDYDKDGELPCIENMVYVFRIEEKQLLDELNELTKTGLVIFENGVYFIKNWHSRQMAMDTNERSLRYRESKQKREYYEHETNMQHDCNDNATIRDADIDKEEIKDTDIEKIKKQNRFFVGEFLRISEIPGIRSDYDGNKLCELRDKYGEQKVLRFADWCKNRQILTIEDALKAAETALPKWKDAQPPKQPDKPKKKYTTADGEVFYE